MALTHIPVLLEEVLEALAVKAGGFFVDGTAGGGGHAEAILKASSPDGRLLAIDRDEAAVCRVRERLARWGERAVVVHGDFADLATCLAGVKSGPVDGVLLDLGMSSQQVDDPERGFSFLREGPLDMRMDPTAPLTAAQWLNEETEQEMVRVLKAWGEEPAARRIAQAIVSRRAERPFSSTAELAGLVEKVKGGRRGKKTHPATQTFQAVRMAVNREMDQIERGLEAALKVVRPGGRVAAISFHSVEDRLVKHTLAAHVPRWESLQEGGQRRHGRLPAVRWVRRKPWVAGPEERASNARARSAKLRAVEVEACAA